MKIVAILRGLVLNPLLVAFARGVAETAVMAGIIYGADYLASDAIPDQYKLLLPIATLAIRQLEGVADKIDPAKQRRREALREQSAVASDPSTTLQVGDVQ